MQALPVLSFTPNNPSTDTSSYNAAVQVFGNRFENETDAEYKLRNSTPGQLVSRAFSTFLAEFVSCWIFYTCIFVHASSGIIPDLIETPLLVLCVVAFVGMIFVRENAAHLDPVITAGVLIIGKYSLPWYYSFAHFLAQPLGALVATLTAWGLTPGFDRTLGLGYEGLQPGFTPGQGFGACLLGNLIIYSTFIWLIGAEGQKNYYEQTGSSHKKNVNFNLAMGFVHAAAVIAFRGRSGPNFGWYLHFFPGVISGTWDTSNWWIPFIASPIAMLFTLALYFLYRYVDNLAYVPILEKYKKGSSDNYKIKGA